MQRSLWNRLATFVVWLLAAGSVVFWALKFVRGPVAPVSAAMASPSASSFSVDPQALAKGLGGGQIAPSPNAASPSPSVQAIQASRFLLTGVVVDNAKNGSGVALIAVDGKPPRPYRVGAVLADGAMLHSVAAGRAMLSVSSGEAPSLTLELPMLTSAVAGTAMPARPAFSPAPVAAAARPAAIPMPPADSRAPRFGANRQREESRAAPAEQAEAPAQR